MTLPTINTNLRFTTKLPSTGKTVTYRPFLASEEKLILVARETEDLNTILGLMEDILEACVLSDEQVKSWPIYDSTYLFIQIRAKSVGEQDDLKVACSECAEINELSFNYEQDVRIDRLDKVVSTIKLSDEFTLKVKVPSISQIRDLIAKDAKDSAQDTAMIIACIEGIMGKDEYWAFQDYSIEEQHKFLGSLTIDQQAQLKMFVGDFPQVAADVAFTCVKCKAPNSIHLEGPANFFG